MKILKSDISETYKVQVDYLKDSQSDYYDENYMKQKVNTFNQFHNILRLFEVLPNFPFTTSETMGNCYL